MSCCNNNRPLRIIMDCGGGDTETVEFVASNANVTGTGVFLAQGDTTLTFRGIASSGGTITITADNVNNTVNVEADTTAITAAIPDATTNTKGKVELATDVEAMGKTDTARAITPSNLAALGASTTFIGLTRLATNAETIAGALSTVAVTPVGLDAVLDTFPTQQVFANNAARLAAVPAFIGQIGVQQDTLIPYLGSNTLAGYFDAPLLAAGIPNPIEVDTEFAFDGAELSITSVSNQGIIFANGGVLHMASTGRMYINNTVVPADSVIITSSTAGQLSSMTLQQILSTANFSPLYTITGDTVRRTFDPTTVTLSQLGDVVATLIRDLAAVDLPEIA